MNASIVITESYMNSVYKLDTLAKKLTFATVKQLSTTPQNPSLRIHSINKSQCDSTFRSARVNDDLRVIFSMQGHIYMLLYVDRHDDAYKWCDGKYIRRTNFGAEYIYDEKVMLATEKMAIVPDYLSVSFEKPLLSKMDIKEKNLVKLGVPQIHANNLLSITSEDAFIDYIAIFPAEIQEALLDLATGTKNFNTVYNELIDEQFDANIDEAIKQKDSKRRFYTTQSIEELQILMENDSFEKWTLFLHPSQEKIVQKDFNGPALIEGGPGTGKTIVGIHRAVYLSENFYKADEGKRILFCTFSKKLAKSISAKVDSLMKQRGVKNNVDVLSVDSFIYNILKDAYGFVKPVNPSAFSNLLEKLYDDIKPKGTKGFYEYEYHEIIERYNIKTLDEYLLADRSGTGMPLDKTGRTTAWQFIEKLLVAKQKNNIMTFIDRSYMIYYGIENGEILPEYDSIIIDEAQDLEPIKLKALCKCVKTSTNNVLILSDMNQRIFKLSTWKNDANINIVGRTYHLSINYRTTKQINDYARYQFISSEIISEHIKEYKSIVNGVDPIVIGFKSQSEQYKFVVNKVKELLQKEYTASQICLICPTKEDCNQIQSILTFADIKSTLLFDDVVPSNDSGICICPIQGVKGLEFEVVFIYNYNNIGKGKLNDTDTAAIRVNYTKLIECEKYVAATRARDELIISYMEVGDL